MAFVIAINGLEKNVGVTTTCLTLGERLSQFTDKPTCIVELDKENLDLSYIIERKRIPTRNIDTIIGYFKIGNIETKLHEVINDNVIKFKNSKLGCIYGSKLDREFTESQYIDLTGALSELFEVIIYDFGTKKLPRSIIENIDLHLLIAQCNYRYIDKVKRNKDDYININTQLVLNYYDKGMASVKREISSVLPEINIIGDLPSSNTLNTKFNEGNVNIAKGKYSARITKLANKIIKKNGLEYLTEKKSIFGKKVNKEEDIYVNDYKGERLGDILLELNLITEKDLNKALEIQKKRSTSKIFSNG